MRSDLLSGTVTFLFTDVEGSTRLLQELGAEAYADALAEHRRLIREACAAEGGVEVDTQGDAFFFAFPSAPGALAAASAFTDALGPGPIQVRVGLHTGTPLLTAEGYVGDDVHFAARVASSGHGGQVVLSAATAELVELELTDLGEHRLKDIEQAVSIFQLGEGSFPPLKTISNTNLPRPASSFLGREAELAEVLSRIEAGARLVTLTGPGGTGKTRLALEAATSLVPEYKAGVFWVGLASLRDPALVTETIAQALGAKDELAKHIGERELLLLLDNLEQVIEAAPELGALLSACPNLTLLVTSRELLRISGEFEYPVPPLAEPEAVELFCARAQLEPADEIAELCARLDSLPLAVELAAARCKVLTPAQILERLSGRLDLLKGGRDADPRQQTLRATIEWSYDLLTPEEQELFARMSVFAGGCMLEAAEEVCDADLDTLQSLVEKSLLRFTPSESSGRYWMLETVREYAAGRLDESEASRLVREQYARHFLDLAEMAEHQLDGDDRVEWLDLLELERDNFRCVLDWADAVEDPEVELRLATALRHFWSARGPLTEGLRRLEAAVGRGGDMLPERRVEALKMASLSALNAGEYETAERLGEQFLRLARLRGAGGDEVSAFIKLSHAAAGLGRSEDAWSLMEQAVSKARDSGDSEALARAFVNLGVLAASEGDFARTAELSQASLHAGGDILDAQVKAIALNNLGEAWLRLGEPDRAEDSLRRALEVASDLGDYFLVAGILENLAVISAARDGGHAARLLGAAHAALEEVGGDVDAAAMTAVLEAVDEGEYERAYADGRKLTIDEAVALALASLD